MPSTVEYGQTGLKVSRLCFGTGQISFNRFDFTPERGADLLRAAYDLGVNFVDTALDYRTHPHVALALKHIGRQKIVVLTKTGAATAEDARAAIEQTLRELGTGYVDVMLLHGVRSADDLRRREGALAELCRAKDEGLIRAVGASTHVFTGSAMRACTADPRIQAILTVVNPRGIGMRCEYEGLTYADHVGLVQQAHAAGKAISAMKVMAEGLLADEAEAALRYAFTLPGVDVVDLGMMSAAQVEMALRVAAGEQVSDDRRAAARENAKQPWGLAYPNAYR